MDVPADLPNVTGIGGLQMQAGTFTSGTTTYFGAASGTDNISSLLSYVPEVVWNEDSTSGGINSGGGGTSLYVSRPSWQAGVPGIPAGNFRLVPDISLQGSIESPGFLYCTSDQSYWQTGQTASCNSGFRDSSSQLLTVAGGTSFGAPIMAGMLAILNQAKHGAGQGNINPTLYGLASNSTTYAAAFHDVTSGNNACTAGPTYCSTAGASGYSAGVGYDEASGLGSIDFAQLLNVWPAVAGSTNLPATTTVLTAATTSPASGATDVITITVSSGSGTPTGSVTVTTDGIAAATATLTNGVATYTFPGTATGGSHVVTAVYKGDSGHAPSTGSISLTLSGTATPGGTFAVSATGATVPVIGTANSTITVSPSSGYNGTVTFTLTGLPSSVCYALPSIGLPNSTVQSATLTIGSGSSVCSGTGAVGAEWSAGGQACRERAGWQAAVPPQAVRTCGRGSTGRWVCHAPATVAGGAARGGDDGAGRGTGRVRRQRWVDHHDPTTAADLHGHAGGYRHCHAEHQGEHNVQRDRAVAHGGQDERPGTVRPGRTSLSRGCLVLNVRSF